MIEKLIAKLEADLEMEGQIVKTDSQHFVIPLDDEIEVEAVELEKSFVLKSEIGAIPGENCGAFLQRTLEADLFGFGTRNGVIGLNEEGKLLTLSMELEYTISFDKFKERMEDFITVLAFWREEALKHA